MARNSIKHSYRQAKRVAHALQHPEKFAEEQMLKMLPPHLRQIYRDLKHPPSAEQLLKRYLRHLERSAKAHAKHALKQRPRPTYRPEPEPYVPPSAEDRIIEIDGETVRITGLPSHAELVVIDRSCEGMSSPGIMEEVEQALLAEITENIKDDLVD
jgi:hypothetical protein